MVLTITNTFDTIAKATKLVVKLSTPIPKNTRRDPPLRR